MLKPKISFSFVPKVSFVLLFILTTTNYLSFANTKEDLTEEYRLKGYEEKEKGNLNAALTFYIKAVSLGSNNPSLFNDMGVLYEQTGYDKRAEENYLKALQIKKNYLPALSNLALFYKRQGQMEKAASFFRMRYELSNLSDPWAQKARDELVAIHPAYRDWVLKMEAEKFQRELAQKQRQEFEEKIALAGEHFKKGEEYSSAKKFKKAIEEYNRALLITPHNPHVLKARKAAQTELSKSNMQAYYNRAMNMMDAGNSVAARVELERMLSTIPGNQP